jgi:hypothetical protein
MSKTTQLGEAQITPSSHDVITVELVEPDERPAWPVVGTPPTVVRIAWPLHPTVIDPSRFRDVAAAVVKLFSEAHIALAHIRAGRKL